MVQDTVVMNDEQVIMQDAISVKSETIKSFWMMDLWNLAIMLLSPFGMLYWLQLLARVIKQHGVVRIWTDRPAAGVEGNVCQIPMFMLACIYVISIYFCWQA